MQPVLPTRLMLTGFFAALSLPGQTTPTPSASSPSQAHAEGIPARAMPSDYQAHKAVGNITIAAEFTGHFVNMPDKMLTTDDWVIVEVGIFGPDGTKLQLSPDHFSLRINQKKNPTPSEPSVRVNSNLRDPDWVPPDQQGDKKSKTAIASSAGGTGNLDNGPPPPVHIPLEMQRAMAERALKASLEEGERALPQAGLLYFRYGGKDKSIQTVELVYNGPAGKATLELQPIGH